MSALPCAVCGEPVADAVIYCANCRVELHPGCAVEVDTKATGRVAMCGRCLDTDGQRRDGTCCPDCGQMYHEGGLCACTYWEGDAEADVCAKCSGCGPGDNCDMGAEDGE